MKLLYLSLFCIFCPHFLKAEEEPKSPEFIVSFSDNSPKIGDVVEVILRATIPDGLHMYSTYNKCEVGPLKLDLNFIKHKSYLLMGSPYSIGDKKAFDEVFQCEIGQFEKIAEVRQKIKILSSDVIISGNIEGQWCTETVCFNFGGLQPVKFASTLKASASKAQPSTGKGKSPSKPQGSKKTKSIQNKLSYLKPDSYIVFG